jgi:hypothetical protein
VLRIGKCSFGSFLPFALPIILVPWPDLGADSYHFTKICPTMVTIASSPKSFVAKGLVGFEKMIDKHWLRVV